MDIMELVFPAPIALVFEYIRVFCSLFILCDFSLVLRLLLGFVDNSIGLFLHSNPSSKISRRDSRRASLKEDMIWPLWTSLD
jgi:hypothetical protein